MTVIDTFDAANGYVFIKPSSYSANQDVLVSYIQDATFSITKQHEAILTAVGYDVAPAVFTQGSVLRVSFTTTFSTSDIMKLLEIDTNTTYSENNTVVDTTKIISSIKNATKSSYSKESKHDFYLLLHKGGPHLSDAPENYTKITGINASLTNLEVLVTLGDFIKVRVEMVTGEYKVEKKFSNEISGGTGGSGSGSST